MTESDVGPAGRNTGIGAAGHDRHPPVDAAQPARSAGPWTRGGHRYDLLLLLVVLPLLLAPFERTILRPVIIVVLAAIFLYAMWTSAVPMVLFYLGCGLILVSFAAAAAVSFIHGHGPQELFAAVNVVLCAATIAAVLARFATRFRVNTRILAAAITVFLLIGLLFTYVFAFIGYARTGGFFAQHVPQNPVNYIYFSYITLTTVGYGDFSPVTDLGRMLAVVEALAGQLYLVIVVAVVVSTRSSGTTETAQRP